MYDCVYGCVWECGHPLIMYRDQRTTQLSGLPFILVGDKIAFSPLYQTKLNGHDFLGTGYKCMLLCRPIVDSGNLSWGLQACVDSGNMNWRLQAYLAALSQWTCCLSSHIHPRVLTAVTLSIC